MTGERIIRLLAQLDCRTYKGAFIEADKEAVHTFVNEILESAYLAARGTDQLKTSGNSQLYWKGRADAAKDVRALKRGHA